MLRLLTISASLLLATGLVLAQETISPVMGSSGGADETPPAVQVEQPLKLLVLGDAIGGGLGAGLVRMAEASGRYDVTIRFNEESGLARPEVYDWAATVPKILSSNDYDVIVVMIGANDRQMIRSGNERFAFNSQGWVERYTRQVDVLLDRIAQSGARVYWVSLPPMASASYDEAIRAVNAIQRARVEARGMTYLDIRPALSNPDGSYTDTGPDETGAVRKLRASDGVFFFKAGNNRMAQLVLEAIARNAPPAAVQSGKTSLTVTPPQAASPPAVAPPAKPQVPVFGQTGLAGDIQTVRPDDVTVNAVVVGRDAASASAALQAIRALAPPGSEAEKLFTQGAAGRAPRGRVDDFTVPPDSN